MNWKGIHPRDKWFIGIFAWMPLACLVVYIYHALTIYHEGGPSMYYYDSAGDFVRVDTEVFLLMMIFFILYVTMGIASLIMMKMMIINDLATKNKSETTVKALFVILTLLVGTLFAPIYYHAVLARRETTWAENPPMFEFDT